MAKKRKKQTRRQASKYPNLDPALNLKTRYELLDFDYIDKLSEKEKAWLDKFAKEYNNADLDRKKLKKNLHNTKALKKDCDDRNNARKRCILTRAKASGQAHYLDELNEEQFVNQDFEDKVIKKVDKDSLKVIYRDLKIKKDED